MKTKELYNAPEMEQIELRLDAGLLVLSGGANYTDQKGGVSGDDTYNDGLGF